MDVDPGDPVDRWMDRVFAVILVVMILLAVVTLVFCAAGAVLLVRLVG